MSPLKMAFFVVFLILFFFVSFFRILVYFLSARSDVSLGPDYSLERLTKFCWP